MKLNIEKQKEEELKKILVDFNHTPLSPLIGYLLKNSNKINIEDIKNISKDILKIFESREFLKDKGIIEEKLFNKVSSEDFNKIPYLILEFENQIYFYSMKQILYFLRGIDDHGFDKNKKDIVALEGFFKDDQKSKIHFITGVEYYQLPFLNSSDEGKMNSLDMDGWQLVEKINLSNEKLNKKFERKLKSKSESCWARILIDLFEMNFSLPIYGFNQFKELSIGGDTITRNKKLEDWFEEYKEKLNDKKKKIIECLIKKVNSNCEIVKKIKEEEKTKENLKFEKENLKFGEGITKIGEEKYEESISIFSLLLDKNENPFRLRQFLLYRSHAYLLSGYIIKAKEDIDRCEKFTNKQDKSFYNKFLKYKEIVNEAYHSHLTLKKSKFILEFGVNGVKKKK